MILGARSSLAAWTKSARTPVTFDITSWYRPTSCPHSLILATSRFEIPSLSRETERYLTVTLDGNSLGYKDDQRSTVSGTK